MISLRRPSGETVDRYRSERMGEEPTCPLTATPPPGFHHERFSRQVGHGTADFERARRGVQAWAAHRGAGVEVFPADAAVRVGETVALVMRQLGLWVVASCRVVEVVDDPGTLGFTYATLPDHPECGHESFTVRLEGGDVRFDVEATSRPGIPLVRIGSPLTRQLQRRASNAYLDALATWVRTH